METKIDDISEIDSKKSERGEEPHTSLLMIFIVPLPVTLIEFVGCKSPWIATLL